MSAWVGLVPDQLRPALEQLLRASRYADECRADRWQFAVEISELLAGGATHTDIRWLIYRGFVLHGKETTVPGDAERSFRPLPATAIPADARVVLSPAGAKELETELCGTALAPSPPPVVESKAQSAAPEPPPTRPTPEWDADRRELRYQGQVIKRYRVPAENQELILTAFQEEGWPHCIDDPLPPDGEIDPKQRLQATIKSLNRNQLVRLIQFHGNGNGLQVYWELISRTAKLTKADNSKNR